MPASSWSATNLNRLFTFGFFPAVIEVLKQALSLAQEVTPSENQSDGDTAGAEIKGETHLKSGDKPPHISKIPGWDNFEGLWRLMWNTAGRTDAIRLKLRDLGLVPLCMRMLERTGNSGEEARPLLGVILYMCTCDAVHGTLKDAGVVDAIEQALKSNKGMHMPLVAALAHLYSGVDADADDKAKSLLGQNDISAVLLGSIREAAKNGHCNRDGITYRLSELVHTCESLSRTVENAMQLEAKGAASVLVGALKYEYGLKAGIRGHISRALLYMSQVPVLKDHLLKAGVPEALKVC